MKDPGRFSSPQYGGGGGGPFNDEISAGKKFTGIRAITVRYDDYVQGIQVSYTTADGPYDAPLHGGSNPNPATIVLAADEILIRVVGRSGTGVDQLTFITINAAGLRKSYGPYGGDGGAPFIIDGSVMGFFGRSGTGLDAIGVYLAEAAFPSYGGTGGDAFSDSVPFLDPAVDGIQYITIRHGSGVDSIQTTYRLKDGNTCTSDIHGSSSGGSPTTIYFETGEKITAVNGRSGSKIDQLSFVTTTPSGGQKTYGPYGGNGGSPFTVTANITGFFGRSDFMLDAIGFYIAKP